MEFSRFCRVLERIASTRGTNEKVTIVRDFLGQTPPAEISRVARAFTGILVPRNSQAPTNLAYKSVWNILLKLLDVTPAELERARQEHGDLGATARALFKTRHNLRQTTLVEAGAITLADVEGFLLSLQFSGAGSYKRKKLMVRNFLDRLSPLEAKYFIRFLLMWLNIGLQASLVMRAIADLTDVEEALVNLAVMKYPDVGEVARVAITKGQAGLEAIHITPLVPVLPMLAMPAASIKSALRDFAYQCAVEYKYDGIRVQLHQVGDVVEIYSRRLSRLTRQFPDVVAAWQDAKPSGSLILEGELVGFHAGKLAPFQTFMRRLRQHDIARVVTEVPVALFAFDVLYCADRDVTALPYAERYEILRRAVRPNAVIQFATRLVSGDYEEVEVFYHEAVAAGCEGVMLKDLQADYAPGTRGTRMLKFKATLDSLDLVLVGAEYGEGRKSAIFSRFFFAAYDEARTRLTTVAKVSTGFTDEQYAEINARVAPLVTKRKGRQVEVAPALVCEILADEILESPRFATGYALRFARLVRFREDLAVEDADDVSKIRAMYRAQRARKAGGPEAPEPPG